MFHFLLYPLRDSFSPFNVFGYITFRAAMAAITAFIVGVLLGPYIIRWLQKMKIGQHIRGEGIPDLYERHQNKAGTPTMGGILILLSIVLSILLWGNFYNRYVYLVLIVTILLGLIGFYDDYLKLRKKHYSGLGRRAKFIGQILIGVFFSAYLFYNPDSKQLSGIIGFPFFKNLIINLGIFYIVVETLILVGTSNAVNLTDGLDGLAIGCVIITGMAYAILSYIVGRYDYSHYLNLIYVPGGGELTVVCATLVGSGMAFLWYNCHPAELFMGDTGSLALGGAIGATAIIIKQEFLLPIIGGIFVAEAISVILQVASFKLRGKRIFLMSPLHHHFEMKGWHEEKIITRFLIVATILSMLGLATIKLR